MGLGLDRHGDAPEERHEQRAERARGVRDLGPDARGPQRQAEAARRGRGAAQGRGEAQHAPARAARPQARRRVDDERERERRREAQQHEVAAEHRRQVRRAPVEPAQRRALAVRAGRLLAERRERAQTQTRHEEEREEDGADAPLGAAEVARQVRVDRAEADGRQHGAREVQTQRRRRARDAQELPVAERAQLRPAVRPFKPRAGHGRRRHDLPGADVVRRVAEARRVRAERVEDRVAGVRARRPEPRRQGPQVRRRAAPDDDAGVDEAAAVDERQDLGPRLVQRAEHGDGPAAAAAAPRDAPERAREPQRRARVEARRRLVQEQRRRRAQQLGRDRRAPRLAARAAPLRGGRLVVGAPRAQERAGAGLELQRAEHAPHGPNSFARGLVGGPAQARVEEEVLRHGQRRREPGVVLLDERERRAPRAAAEDAAADLDGAPLPRAPRRAAADGPQQRRLPGARRAHDAAHLARGRAPVRALHDERRAAREAHAAPREVQALLFTRIELVLVVVLRRREVERDLGLDPHTLAPERARQEGAEAQPQHQRQGRGEERELVRVQRLDGPADVEGPRRHRGLRPVDVVDDGDVGRRRGVVVEAVADVAPARASR